DDLALETRCLLDTGRIKPGDFLGAAHLRGERHHSQHEKSRRGCRCFCHHDLHTLTLPLFTNAPAGSLCRCSPQRACCPGSFKAVLTARNRYASALSRASAGSAEHPQSPFRGTRSCCRRPTPPCSRAPPCPGPGTARHRGRTICLS